MKIKKEKMKNLGFVCVLVVLTILTSCDSPMVNNIPTNHNNNNLENVSNSNIYPTEAVLNQVSANNETYANWKIARVLALYEMEDFAEDNNWNACSLSEKPVIIYSTESEPKYFEFHVLSNGKAIGAVTCAARKDLGNPVQYVMEYTLPYEEVYNRGLGEVKIIDNNYPTSFAYQSADSRAIYDPKANRSLPNITEEKTALDIILNADDKLLVDLGIDTEEKYQEMLKGLQDEKIKNDILWEELESNSNLILSLTEEEISQSVPIEEQSRGSYDKRHFAEPWFSRRSMTTKGDLWCGPYVAYFITSAGDVPSNVTFSQFLRKIGSGPKTWNQLNSGLKSLSSYRLMVNTLHLWRDARDQIRGHKLPLISLRGSSFNHSSVQWHYRAIIGIREQKKRKKIGFFKYYVKNYWYYMHDNGSDGKNFWESNNHASQIQTADIRRK